MSDTTSDTAVPAGSLRISQFDMSTRAQVDVATGHQFIVTDAEGTRWRIRSNPNGPGISVQLSEATDGSSAMSIDPESSNYVILRSRGGA